MRSLFWGVLCIKKSEKTSWLFDAHHQCSWSRAGSYDCPPGRAADSSSQNSQWQDSSGALSGDKGSPPKSHHNRYNNTSIFSLVKHEYMCASVFLSHSLSIHTPAVSWHDKPQPWCRRVCSGSVCPGAILLSLPPAVWVEWCWGRPEGTVPSGYRPGAVASVRGELWPLAAEACPPPWRSWLGDWRPGRTRWPGSWCGDCRWWGGTPRPAGLEGLHCRDCLVLRLQCTQTSHTPHALPPRPPRWRHTRGPRGRGSKEGPA